MLYDCTSLKGMVTIEAFIHYDLYRKKNWLIIMVSILVRQSMHIKDSA